MYENTIDTINSLINFLNFILKEYSKTSSEFVYYTFFGIFYLTLFLSCICIYTIIYLSKTMCVVHYFLIMSKVCNYSFLTYYSYVFLFIKLLLFRVITMYILEYKCYYYSQKLTENKVRLSTL